MNSRSPHLIPPNSRGLEELERLRDQVTLHTARAILFIGIPVSASMMYEDFEPGLLSLCFAFCASLLAGMHWVRNGRSVLGRYVVVGVIALILVTWTTLFGGVGSVPYFAWVVVVLLASALIDRRASFVAAAAGIAVGGLLLYLEPLDLLAQSRITETSTIRFHVSATLFVIAALLAWSMTRSVEQALGRMESADRDRRLLIERYRLAGAGAQFGIWEWSPSIDLLWLGPGIQEIVGDRRYSESGCLGSWLDRVHPEDRECVESSFRELENAQNEVYGSTYRIVHNDGNIRWVRARGQIIRAQEGTTRLVGSLEDITKARALEMEMARRAFHDPLTGLPNRDLFLDRVRSAISRAQRNQHADYAVAFIDLDRFKVVNDSLGHSLGDEILRRFAARLSQTLRAPDTVARLSGDEFALLLEDIGDHHDARAVLSRLLRSLSSPFLVGERHVVIHASIGVVMGSLEVLEPLDLLRDADLAMYSVKRHPNQTIGIFHPSMRDEVDSLLELDYQLEQGLAAGRIVPYFQPIVDLRTGRTLGFESLARWVLPDGNVLLPAKFIARAEETGLIAELDRSVLTQAARFIGNWNREGGNYILSSNISARQLTSLEFAEWLLATLRQAELPPQMMQLEVTEGTLLSNLPGVRQTFEELRAHGVRIAFDDFGTGYSSMSYLHRFEIEVLKIDLAFVQERGVLGPGPICRAIQSVADAFGIETVGEGIETLEQCDALIEMGCTKGQGYLFGRAQPASQLRPNEEKATRSA